VLRARAVRNPSVAQRIRAQRKELAMIRLLVAGTLALVTSVAWAVESFVVEDWNRLPVGTRGIPPDWKGQNWGSPVYEFTVVADGEQRVLHMVSKNEGSTISKEVRPKVNLKDTPVLEWTWKVVTLPKGANSCKKETDDQAAQVFVTWPRFPELIRSRIIGYVWDSTAPVGTVCKSEKTGTVTYMVIRSGSADLGKWMTERRNIRDDFKQIYGEDPDNPAAVSVAIDSNDTRSLSESYMGKILFRRP
jgi:hypothetical protein